MNTLKAFILTVLVVISTSMCYARKFAIDSIDAVTKEHVRVAELNMGDADYHKYGKLVMEQKGNKYSITFPYFAYTDPPPLNTIITNEEDTIRKRTQIILQLDNGKIVSSVTQEDINFESRYWWHYYTMPPYNGPASRNSPSLEYIYRYKNYLPFNLLANGKNMIPLKSDLYGECWQIKSYYTRADMLQLRKHRIVSAYIIRKGRNQYLPIKHKQSKKIQKSVAALLHK